MYSNEKQLIVYSSLVLVCAESRLACSSLRNRRRRKRNSRSYSLAASILLEENMNDLNKNYSIVLYFFISHCSHACRSGSQYPYCDGQYCCVHIIISRK